MKKIIEIHTPTGVFRTDKTQMDAKVWGIEFVGTPPGSSDDSTPSRYSIPWTGIYFIEEKLS